MLIYLSIMSTHHGKILETAIRQSGYPISKIAKRIGYTRQHLYNLFDKRKLNIELLLEIERIINMEFSGQIKELNHVKKNDFLNEESLNFKERYFSLLEEYNKVLKENNSLLKLLNKKSGSR